MLGQCWFVLRADASTVRLTGDSDGELQRQHRVHILRGLRITLR